MRRWRQQHRGAAFVEILQNCNIYNDGVSDVVRNEKENRLYLKAGEEVRWGDRGVRMPPTGRSRSSTPPSAGCSGTIPAATTPVSPSRSRG